MQQVQQIELPSEPTVIDALNSDAAPREYPKGAPGLWPYLKLPFRERAKFFSVYRRLNAKQAELMAAEKKRRRGKPTDDQLMQQAEDVYELYALMDDMMIIAAVDKDAYREWVDEHTDDEFADLFSIYVERSQPGEASGSENS